MIMIETRVSVDK